MFCILCIVRVETIVEWQVKYQPCKEGVVFYVVRVREYGRKLHVGSGHLLPTVTTVLLQPHEYSHLLYDPCGPWAKVLGHLQT